MFLVHLTTNWKLKLGLKGADTTVLSLLKVVSNFMTLSTATLSPWRLGIKYGSFHIVAVDGL